MDVLVVDHPLARARLSTMRDARTDNAAFRAALRDLTLMLIYEATRDAAETTAPLHTPVARTTGYRLANPPLLVPVLRAGLGHGRRRAGAHAGGADRVRRHRPQRGDPPADAVHGVAAGVARRATRVRARPDARHRRLDAAHDRAARGARGERRHRDLRARRARRASPGCGRAACRCGSSPRPSTSGSTTRPTSCPASATRATASSAPSRLPSPRAPRARRPRTGRPRSGGRNPRSCSATQPCTVVQRVSDTSAVSASGAQRLLVDGPQRRPRAAARARCPPPSGAPPRRDSSVGPENMRANRCGSSSALSR